MQTTMSHGSDDRSFLTGPTLYLRGIERDDAKVSSAWIPSLFPAPADLVLERLEAEEARDEEWMRYRLVACRRSDDRPVGSVECESEDQRSCYISIHSDPLLGEADAIRAEILRLVVPWLLHEREMMVVWLEAPEGDRAVAEAGAGLGMRVAFRLREAVWHDGSRQAVICYEALHPAWVERLGMPGAAEEGSVERSVRSPAPPRWTGEAPPNAFVVGERLYLRPIEQADAEEMARWSAKEPESFHDTGRHIRSPIANWKWNRKHAEADPPSWIRFAIVAKEGDVVIGMNGLLGIDWIARTAETETEIVRPDYRGTGYGTEAKHLLLEYAFERLGLHMVRSYVWEFNTRSRDALIKQGYRIAGRVAWTGLKNAQFVDDLVFDLLASEWRESRKAVSR
jgi:RimJ/RimL family protein N-acetyltransferase